MSPRSTTATSLVLPPLKIQGGKTRLIPFLCDHLTFVDGRHRWVEPFLGAGGVLLNVLPSRALVADANPHLVGFYRALQREELTPESATDALQTESALLRRDGEEHFYAVRDRFNARPSPLDFLFLNHTCFNGLIRFNRRGEFNSPFCRNRAKLTPSLIIDIAARLKHAQIAARKRDWTFVCQYWRDTLARVDENDFVYADPPYAGRHNTYFSGWNEESAADLAICLRRLPGDWALSDWAADANGENPRLAMLYPGHEVRTSNHRYVVGASARSRSRLTEALVLSKR